VPFPGVRIGLEILLEMRLLVDERTFQAGVFQIRGEFLARSRKEQTSGRTESLVAPDFPQIVSGIVSEVVFFEI
jgi:hypothetical protein